MISFILSLIVGGIIGFIAEQIMNAQVPGGVIGNIILGFIGAWLGTLLLGSWGWVIQGFAVFPAIIGAVVVVFLVGLITGNR